MKNCKRLTALILALTLTFFGLKYTVEAAVTAVARRGERRTLAVGGELVGIRLKTKGVLIVGTDSFGSGGRTVSPAADAGLKKGDVLLTIGGEETPDGGTVTRLISQSAGLPLTLTFERDGETKTATLTPELSDATGEYKGGLWVRDSAAGIGTLTYSDPATGRVAALGHGIYDADTGGIMTVSGGVITDALFTYVVKGTAGAPGEIGGALGDGTLAEVTANTDEGVFGTMSVMEGEQTLYETAFADEVKPGPAEIVCTVSADGKTVYDAEITRVLDRKSETKNLIVKVTDERLVDVTGGIVQGMSGAPILQNGRFVGAVTHVFVNDPLSGYGIFIGNMLD